MNEGRIHKIMSFGATYGMSTVVTKGRRSNLELVTRSVERNPPTKESYRKGLKNLRGIR